jgi:uncharacterized protein with FMN-binding domain
MFTLKWFGGRSSAAFLSALDKPAGLQIEEVSLTGSEDAGNPTTTVVSSVSLLPETTTSAATAAVTAPLGTVLANTIPVATVPPPPTTVPVTTVLVDPNACTAAPIDGPSVTTRWGPVQVQAVLRTDGTVCEVTALVTPSAHRKSVQINDRAKPILHDRVVAAGGTEFQSVSGATVTSKGYRASLQAILDNA